MHQRRNERSYCERDSNCKWGNKSLHNTGLDYGWSIDATHICLALQIPNYNNTYFVGNDQVDKSMSWFWDYYALLWM